MEHMIPFNHPAYAGNAVFVSLYIDYKYIFKTLMENTTYFPNVNSYKNNLVYQEIQPRNLTVALTPKYEIKALKIKRVNFGAEHPLFVSHSLILNSARGI
jgi:hypothetical protein